jgi:pimeloyl-ACP methyl ester carboxylesterase
VVLVHGYTGCKETLDVTAAYLCGHGWLCLTFDFRGHKLGGSDGAMNTAQDALDDVRAAVADVRRETGSHAVALVGHSMGGAAALALAADDADIVGVATLGTSATVVTGFETRSGEAMMALRGDYVVGAPAEVILQETGDLCRAALERMRSPALFVAARADIIVRPDTVHEMARLYGDRAEYVIVEGGHMDLPVRSRGFVGNWLERINAGSQGPRTD